MYPVLPNNPLNFLKFNPSNFLKRHPSPFVDFPKSVPSQFLSWRKVHPRIISDRIYDTPPLSNSPCWDFRPPVTPPTTSLSPIVTPSVFVQIAPSLPVLNFVSKTWTKGKYPSLSRTVNILLISSVWRGHTEKFLTDTLETFEGRDILSPLLWS